MNMNALTRLDEAESRRAALLIVGIYTAISLVWILLSDAVVDRFFSDSLTATAVQPATGFGFVIVTGVMLYYLTRAVQRRERGYENLLRDALDSTRDGFWVWDLETDRIEVTPGGDADLGWGAAGSITNRANWFSVMHPDDWAPTEAILKDYLSRPGNDTWVVDHRIRDVDGNWIWYQVKGTVTARSEKGAPILVEGTYYNIDRIKGIQHRLERSNRALRDINLANRAIAITERSDRLFDQVTAALSAVSDYKIIWVEKVVPNGANAPTLVSVAGSAAGDYCDKRKGGASRPITGLAFSRDSGRAGHVVALPDVTSDGNYQDWRDLVRKHGVRSVISIPIRTGEVVDHTLNIACSLPYAFAEDNAQSYEALAGDLCDAFRRFDVEARYQEVESDRNRMSMRLELALKGTITAFATTVEMRDPYTAGHQSCVAELSVAIARRIGLSEQRIEGIRIGAGMHDIGKIAIPSEILTKPGKLDELEYALIQRHAEFGYEIVREINFGWPVAKIVHQHHERMDGSGYPQGLKGEEISLEARIVAVADVVESMGTHRPYRKKLPWSHVIRELREGRGIRYDSEVVDAALDVLEVEAARFGFVDG